MQARADNGTGNCIAQIELTVGSLIMGGAVFGLEAKLFCFKPTLDDEKEGLIEECLRLRFPAGARREDVKWELRGMQKSLKCKLVGSKPVDSYRMKIGITEASVTGYNGVHIAMGKQKKHFERDKKAGDDPRWRYPSSWKKEPEEIEVSGFSENDEDLNGTYVKRDCILTTPHSALWTKEAQENGGKKFYIVVKPNVSRVRPDTVAISESPSPYDSTRYRALMERHYQPCLAMVSKEVNCLTPVWLPSKNFKAIVPVNKLEFFSPKIPNDPSPNKPVTVAEIKGFSADVLSLLTEHSQGQSKLNVYNGIDGQKTRR